MTVQTIVIAIGADHRGFAMKQLMQEKLLIDGFVIRWLDVGAHNADRSDYPFFSTAVCNHLLEKQALYGILLCGTGVGMSIIANRYQGIFAALVWNEEIARRSKEEDNANVLVLPSDYISHDQALGMVKAWLAASFKGGRYAQRIAMIGTL